MLFSPPLPPSPRRAGVGVGLARVWLQPIPLPQPPPTRGGGVIEASISQGIRGTRYEGLHPQLPHRGIFSLTPT